MQKLDGHGPPKQLSVFSLKNGPHPPAANVLREAISLGNDRSGFTLSHKKDPQLGKN